MCRLQTLNHSFILLQACQPVSRYISNDYLNKCSYLSCDRPIDDNVAKFVKQAAVRSLSCEIIAGKEGEIYFGDEIRGHALSQSFSLEDSQARGFHRWYSVLVFMRDKHFLQNSWLFIQKHINQMKDDLQSKAAQVYAREQQECPRRALRLTEGEQRCGGNTTARRITELTAEPNLFAQIHLWFTWILSTGAKRLEQPPTAASVRNFYQRADSGFVIVEQFNADTVRLLRQLCSTLEAEKARSLLHAVSVGRQLVVRGPKRLTQSVLNILRYLLPSHKCTNVLFAESYAEHDTANIVGLDLSAAVPVASSTVERLDIVPNSAQDDESRTNYVDLSLNDHQYMAKSGAHLPPKLPTFVTSVHAHLMDSEISDQIAYLLISAMIDKWSSRASVIQKCRAYGKDASKYLQAEGVLDCDYPLLEFWSS